MSKTKRKWIVLDWLKDGCLRAQDIAYSATQSIADAIDSTPWIKDGTIIKPRTSTDDVQITKLAGTADTVPVTDADGKLEDTPVTITDGPDGGDAVNMDAHPTGAITGLLAKDLYLQRKDANTVELSWYDGTDTYKVELTK